MASNRAIMPRADSTSSTVGRSDEGLPSPRTNLQTMLKVTLTPGQGHGAAATTARFCCSPGNALVLCSQPYPYEINTWPWLEAISRTEGRAIDLGTVPDRYWDEIADLGFDGVWLMGVWQRSPAGIGIALTNDDLRVSFDAALPDWQPYDVVGSPYCVRGYVVDDHFGGRSALASARQALAARGMGLILDFVPNHVAPDHP